MKIMKIILMLILSFPAFSNIESESIQNARAVNVQSDFQVNKNSLEIFPMGRKNIPPFDFKAFLEDKNKFEEFITANLKVIDLKSSKEISSFLKQGSSKLFFSSFFEKTPLLSEFIFQSLKKPDSIAKFMSLFLEFNKIILFFIMMIGTFILSHFLGEFKFLYEPLSFQRIGFAFLRIGVVNSIRLGIFVLLFSAHTAPLFNVYVDSVVALQKSYPILNSVLGFIS